MKNAIVSLLVSCAIVFAALHWPPEIQNFGNVNPTQISTATNLSAFPAVFNANMTLLDAGKIDVGTTSVASITTLGSLSLPTSQLSGTITTASGGTGQNSSSWSGMPFIVSGTWAYIATSSPAVSSSFSYSGNLGSLAGGTSGTLSSVIQPSFTYSTSTTWTATTTVYLQQVNITETINGIRCKVLPHGATLNIQTFYGTGTTTMLTASTTNNFNVYASNNTPAAGNVVGINIGTPATSPTNINCTYKITY